LAKLVNSLLNDYLFLRSKRFSHCLSSLFKKLRSYRLFAVITVVRENFSFRILTKQLKIQTDKHIVFLIYNTHTNTLRADSIYLKYIFNKVPEKLGPACLPAFIDFEFCRELKHRDERPVMRKIDIG
jgi:hypothetical protein